MKKYFVSVFVLSIVMVSMLFVFMRLNFFSENKEGHIQISFNYYSCKENLSFTLRGDYFTATEHTRRDEASEHVGRQKEIDGILYFGEVGRKGVSSDSILETKDLDYQFFMAYDKVEDLYYLLLDTKVVSQLIIEGVTEDSCVIVDMVDNTEFVDNQKIFQPGNYKLKVFLK